MTAVARPSRIVRVAVDELHGRHDLAVPRGLEKAHVCGVRVEDIDGFQIDALADQASRAAPQRSPGSSRQPPARSTAERRCCPGEDVDSPS